MDAKSRIRTIRRQATAGYPSPIGAALVAPCPSFVSCRSRQRRTAFTFAELLAAMVFVAIVIPVTVRAITVANRSAVVAERKRVAIELGESLLNDMIMTEDWRESTRSGEFGEDWPGYTWTLDDVLWDEDTMRVVSITVSYQVQGRPYNVVLSTLADEEEEQQEEVGEQ
jgi:hypothetical protein